MGERRLARVLIGSDMHGPYLDPKAWGCFLAAANSFPWDLVVLNGDVCDFSQISRHEKQIGGNTRDVKEPVTLDDEIWLVRNKILKPLRQHTGPRTKIWMRLGNHETRWLVQNENDPKVLAEMLKAIRTHGSTKLEEVLGLAELDIRLSYNSVDRLFDLFTLVHGVKCTANAAKANLLKYGDGTSGHTHRMGCHTEVMYGKIRGWWESGCLRTTKEVEYLPKGEVPNWANGFVSLLFDLEQRHYLANSHFIIDGMCEVRVQILRG